MIITESKHSLLVSHGRREGRWGCIGPINSIILLFVPLFIILEAPLVWTRILLIQTVISHQYGAGFTKWLR